MQNNRVNQNKITSKIVNPNFLNNSRPQNSFVKSNFDNNLSNSISTKTILQKIKSARQTSIINLSNLNLEYLPKEIFDENLSFDDINWWQMVEIKKLDASNNKLNSEKFDSDFASIPGLNYLKFSTNLFIEIPVSIFQLKNLKFLDFSYNKIVHLGSQIGNLDSLVDLNLSNNLLIVIPPELSNLAELEILNLSNNKIKQFPSEFVKLKRLDLSENNLLNFQLTANTLEELVLFKNKINEIDISNFRNLAYLDIHNNILSELTKIPVSNKLDTIIIGYNRLNIISNLKNAPNISVLDLNNNKLESLSEEFFYLKQLKTLNLMNNSINDLPPQICFLKNLVRINLDGNPLKKINSKVRQSNAENIKAYLRTRLTEEDLKQVNQECLKDEFLDKDPSNNISNVSIISFIQSNCLRVNDLSLSEIPYEQMTKISNMKMLSTIDFSRNKISDIEGLKELAVGNHLSKLREINVSHNLILDVPQFILNLRNLKIIDFKGNNLTSFCDYEDEFYTKYMKANNLCVFPFLEHLDLSINKLKKIPALVRYVKNLSTLLLANNLISDVSNLVSCPEKDSAYICNEYLDTLDLGNNKIEKISEKWYKKYPNMKNLNLENNEIKTIPTDLCLLLNMNKLNLNGNPIKMLRSSLILAGTVSILDHLRKMHKFTDEDIKHDQKTKQQGQFSQNMLNNNNTSQQCDKMIVDDLENEVEKVNEEILQIESELTGNMPTYKKTELKKKLNALIRFRANLMK